jgi:hypothetical protein
MPCLASLESDRDSRDNPALSPRTHSIWEGYF